MKAIDQWPLTALEPRPAPWCLLSHPAHMQARFLTTQAGLLTRFLTMQAGLLTRILTMQAGLLTRFLTLRIPDQF